MKLDVSKLKFQLLSPSAPTDANKDLYSKVFENWYETWKSAYRAYWKSDEIYSDQFCRQGEQGVLTYEDEIVGTLSFDKKKLDLLTTRTDSYFRMWDDLSYEKLRKASSDNSILVCSWFTLCKKWRKSNIEIDFKVLLVAIGVKEFELRNESLMCGTMVHVGKLNKICFEHNSTEVLTNTKEKGLPVDLMMWERKNVKNMTYPYYKEIIEHLFRERRLQVKPAA